MNIIDKKMLIKNKNVFSSHEDLIKFMSDNYIENVFLLKTRYILMQFIFPLMGHFCLACLILLNVFSIAVNPITLIIAIIFLAFVTNELHKKRYFDGRIIHYCYFGFILFTSLKFPDKQISKLLELSFFGWGEEILFFILIPFATGFLMLKIFELTSLREVYYQEEMLFLFKNKQDNKKLEDKRERNDLSKLFLSIKDMDEEKNQKRCEKANLWKEIININDNQLKMLINALIEKNYLNFEDVCFILNNEDLFFELKDNLDLNENEKIKKAVNGYKTFNTKKPYIHKAKLALILINQH